MYARLAISLALLLALERCTHRPATPSEAPRTPPPAEATKSALDLTEASDSKLQEHVGEQVAMRGQFSLHGKIGPFILVGGRPIYLESRGSFSWEPYTSMEGRIVRVTGALRFAHYPTPSPEALPEARVPDHFFFEAETSKIELFRR